MPPKTNQIQTFEGQIEQSIGLRIEQLKAIDAQKSELLLLLKEHILKSIKQEREGDSNTPEKETKYSEDLRIDLTELEAIFTTEKQAHPQLFSKNKINNFEDFFYFLGMYKDEIAFVHPEKRTIWGKPINLILPLGESEASMVGLPKTLKQIENRIDLKPFITPDTKFTANGLRRIEFSINKEGKTIHYSATPEHILRVDKTPTIKDINEWREIKETITELENQLLEILKNDTSLPDRQKKIVELNYLSSLLRKNFSNYSVPNIGQ